MSRWSRWFKRNTTDCGIRGRGLDSLLCETVFMFAGLFVVVVVVVVVVVLLLFSPKHIIIDNMLQFVLQCFPVIKYTSHAAKCLTDFKRYIKMLK